MNRGSVLGYILYVCCQFIIVWISYIRITEVRVSSEGEDKGDGVHYHSWLYNRSTDPRFVRFSRLRDDFLVYRDGSHFNFESILYKCVSYKIYDYLSLYFFEHILEHCNFKVLIFIKVMS